jgi:3-oxoacyl-[acyl-carrier-protein] synthase-3
VGAVEIGAVAGVTIVGAGTAFPRRSYGNEEVLARLGRRARGAEQLRFVAAGLRERLGVEERAWAHLPGTPFAPDEETTLDLALAAARRALAEARVDDVALVLTCTSTPHRWTSTVAAALGLQAACVDARAGCAGGIWALATAALYLQAGVRPILLVGAETFSKVIPPEHELAVATLADGAAALVLDRGAGRLVAAHFATDGRLASLVRTDGPLPPTAEAIAAGGYLLSGAPAELADVIPGKYQEALGRVGALPSDLLVPHQTGRALLETLSAQFARTYINLHRHGNIGAGGWIAALAEARAEGLARGRVALAAVGGGLSWGAAVLEC